MLITYLDFWKVKQELLTLLEHLSSPAVFSGVRVTRCFVLCVCFVDRCLSFCPFSFGHCAVCSSSFGHCVVCSSSIYRFWLPLGYLQTLLIILKVILASLKIKQTGLKVTNSCLKVTHPRTKFVENLWTPVLNMLYLWHFRNSVINIMKYENNKISKVCQISNKNSIF